MNIITRSLWEMDELIRQVGLQLELRDHCPRSPEHTLQIWSGRQGSNPDKDFEGLYKICKMSVYVRRK